MTSPRPLDENEQALLRALLGNDFEGVGALRQQTGSVLAAPGCTCGCGSLDLFVGSTEEPSTASSPVPGEGILRSPDGEAVGGLLLFLDSGRLSYLEVYSYFEPLPLPPVGEVEWTLVPRE